MRPEQTHSLEGRERGSQRSGALLGVAFEFESNEAGLQRLHVKAEGKKNISKLQGRRKEANARKRAQTRDESLEE